jgi:hypothetical protein
VQEDEICAGSVDAAPCKLDSGSPLFAVNSNGLPEYLVGVVSKADDDCYSVGPAIHAGFDAVSLQWIDDVIRESPTVLAQSAAACRR